MPLSLEPKENADVGEILARFMLDGQDLQRRLSSTEESRETLEPAITSWETECERWLSETLGATYIARFRNDAGIPIGTFTMRRGLNRWEGPLNGFMRVRLARLGEFISEMPQKRALGTDHDGQLRQQLLMRA